MSLATLYSRAQAGVTSPLVTIEVHLANGLPGLSIVGLPELAVKESKDRVRAAILNSHFEFPARRITINLAPADLPKEGGRFDLPIALGILAASGQIPLEPLQQYEFIGELALSGQLRKVRGALPVALGTKQAKRKLIVPIDSASEASLIPNLTIHAAKHLLQVTDHFLGTPLAPFQGACTSTPDSQAPDLSEVIGQEKAKRALELAAAGAHNLLMIGTPGTGKSMLAHRLPGILPPMSEAEALESAVIQSVGHGEFTPDRWRLRPFRTPHHTASAVALVGGGSQPRPGEISLAHQGVLFLDELPEFERRVLEVLREPMETGQISISRAARQVDFPARFQLIGAMNPCPCGHFGDESQNCRCTPEQIGRYRSRISGPLLDRIDLQIEVPRVPVQQLQATQATMTESSKEVQHRVTACRERQLQRAGIPNSELQGRLLHEYCQPDAAGSKLLEQATLRLRLSPRAYHRILRLARTIADLAQSEHITASHISEAISYRSLDRSSLQIISQTA